MRPVPHHDMMTRLELSIMFSCIFVTLIPCVLAAGGTTSEMALMSSLAETFAMRHDATCITLITAGGGGEVVDAGKLIQCVEHSNMYDDRVNPVTL